jgi:3-hydroxyisobutyrate dehydrogenase
MAQIAFIGLGNMGGPMALNLIKAGHTLSVFDLNPAALDNAKQGGAKVANSPEEAVREADFVISMLPSSPHVESLYIEKNLFQSIKKGALIADCSTIAPDSARKVAKAANEQGFEMVDAPVSGGVGGAQAGTLTFIVGGSPAAFEKIKPILSAMGKNIFHAGDSGTGQVAKICNNMLLAIHMIGTSEALNLGVNCGIDPKTLSEIMKVSSGRNWSLEVYNPLPGVMENVPASKNYSGGFGVDLMAKDLGLSQEAAISSRTSTPLGSLALSLYRAHSRNGSGKLDFSSILQFLKGSS